MVEQSILYCAICGCRIKPTDSMYHDGSISDLDFAKKTAWLFEEPQVIIGPLAATNLFVNIAEDPQTGFATHAEWRDEQTVRVSGQQVPVYEGPRGLIDHVYFPTHPVCFSIVQKVLKIRKGGVIDSIPNTLSDFHLALWQQIRRDWANPMYDSRMDYAALSLRWEREDEYLGAADFWYNGRFGNFTLAGEWRYLETDPYGEEDLTTPLLAGLVPFSYSDKLHALLKPFPDTKSHAATPFERLPTEIVRHISSFLTTSMTLLLAQTNKTVAKMVLGDFGPVFWREQLLEGRLFLFFDKSDVDANRCRRFQRETPQGIITEWDWKALAKTLSSRTDWLLKKELTHDGYENYITPVGLWETLPMGFRNRRRIFELAMTVEFSLTNFYESWK